MTLYARGPGYSFSNNGAEGFVIRDLPRDLLFLEYSQLDPQGSLSPAFKRMAHTGSDPQAWYYLHHALTSWVNLRVTFTFFRKKIKQPICFSLLEEIFLPYCQSQLTGQGEVVQDESLVFLLLQAASAPRQEGMGWEKGYEWTCLQKDKLQVFSLNWQRETHFLFVRNTYMKNVRVNLNYWSSLQGFQKA